MQEAQLEPKPRGMPLSAKIGLGCGLGCLVVIIIGIIAMIGGGLWLKEKIDEMQSELESAGFTNTVQGQLLEVTEPETLPTLYKAQVVHIKTDIDSDVAILAQVAEIHSRISGKVYFRGQVLTIHPDAVIGNGLDVKAQMVQKAGTVEGEITGTYQVMQDRVTTEVGAP